MIFRVFKDKENPYVVLHKGFLQDPELSAKAKGILAYLLSLPDDWQIYLDEIVTHFKDGKDSMRAGINELIKHKYIIRSKERNRNEKGHLTTYSYEVFEIKRP